MTSLLKRKHTVTFLIIFVNCGNLHHQWFRVIVVVEVQHPVSVGLSTYTQPVSLSGVFLVVSLFRRSNHPLT